MFVTIRRATPELAKKGSGGSRNATVSGRRQADNEQSFDEEYSQEMFLRRNLK